MGLGRWGWGDGRGDKGVRRWGGGGRWEWGEGSEEMGVGRFTLFPLAHSHLGIPISIHIRNFFYIFMLYVYI